jgi:hypothetical protein
MSVQIQSPVSAINRGFGQHCTTNPHKDSGHTPSATRTTLGPSLMRQGGMIAVSDSLIGRVDCLVIINIT